MYLKSNTAFQSLPYSNFIRTRNLIYYVGGHMVDFEEQFYALNPARVEDR